MIRATFAALVLCMAQAWAAGASPGAGADWAEYLGGPARDHYSSLDQINVGNASRLRVAWEYRTGEPGQVQCNPLVIGGVLYGVTSTGGIFALNAATGQELWRYAAEDVKTPRTLRGLTYWAAGEERRLFFGYGTWLYSLDARTGKPVTSFGDAGRASLRAGLGAEAQDKWITSTTPGTIFEDLIVMPTRVGEVAEAAPGFIQAFNVRTGHLAWTFRTIPGPGDPGYETWSKDSYTNVTVGGANSWAGMAIDRGRGIVYVPTGSAAPDFWGADRKGRNRFANSLIALEARTGKLIWDYQFVHHDIWDRDLPAPPNLLVVERGGRKIDAVAQVTKSGFVFVFDRVTGEPLFPVEEKPFPASPLPGEEAWPTQPVPVRPAPFARQTLTEQDISPYAENREDLLTLFRHARTGAYQPFGKDNTLLLPGFDGGAEWGGAAVDPRGIMYVNANEMAWVGRLQDALGTEALAHLSPGRRAYTVYCMACHGEELKGNPTSGFPALVNLGDRKGREEISRLLVTGKGMMPGFPSLPGPTQQALVDYILGQEKVEGEANGDAAVRAVPVAKGAASLPPPAPYKFGGYLKFLDSKGYPAISPPWGTLTAIDLNTGEHLWRKTLGEFKELTARGIPPTGTENYGGPVVTAGGVLFIAATKDAMFRAFDPRTGDLLWETSLPAAGHATPATYAVEGKQYVVIACGGGKLGTPKGDSYVAFALP